jgi:hypothetical protein
MATLDEITKEKQQVSEALARADAQREKLIGQLGELEAAERVLARYSKARGQGGGLQSRRRQRQRRRRRRRNHVGAHAPGLQKQLASGAARRAWAIRCLPWQPARRSRKSLPRARVLARIMSASSLPGTSGRAASKSATGCSTPPNRCGRSNSPRSEIRLKRLPAAGGSLVEADGRALRRFGTDRVCGGERRATLSAGRRLIRHWTDQLAANRLSGYER